MGTQQDVGFLAEGNLKFGLLASDGVTFIGSFSNKNAVVFEYNPGQPTVKQRIKKNVGQYGRIADQVYIPKPSEISMSFDTIDADGLGTILRGTVSGLTVTGATVAPAAFNFDVLDLWVPLAGGKRFLTATTVTNSATTPAPFVEGLDYDIDYSMGLIIAYSSGNITANATSTAVVKVGFTYGTYSGKSIAAETFTQLNCNILFDGKNLADGRRVQVDVPKAVLAPDKPIDFMSENFAVASLKGSPIAVGSAAPLTVTYITTVPAGF
jgi:hypothetical protein